MPWTALFICTTIVALAWYIALRTGLVRRWLLWTVTVLAAMTVVLANERRWHQLLDGIQLLVVGLDREGRITSINPFAEQLPEQLTTERRDTIEQLVREATTLRYGAIEHLMKGIAEERQALLSVARHANVRERCLSGVRRWRPGRSSTRPLLDRVDDGHDDLLPGVDFFHRK